MASTYIGISGFDYPGWRGSFYPEALPRRRWLEYAANEFDSIELNGTFYSLKHPDVFRAWHGGVPDEFVFAIKGGRFITHNLKLARCETALANFFASGVLALGEKTGPFLWQLPATYRFDAERLDRFLSLLPRDSNEGAQLARHHDHRLRRGALTDAPVAVSYRHALEPRHPTYFVPECYDVLRRHGCALVLADTAGRFPYAEELTADFVYIRLHGAQELYVSGYSDSELAWWADRVARWAGLAGPASGVGRDVYVYFDNDAKVHAPHDARRLRRMLAERRATSEALLADPRRSEGLTGRRAPRPAPPPRTRRARGPARSTDRRTR